MCGEYKGAISLLCHNIGAMIPFIGGVLLLVGIGTMLDKSLNYKMVSVSFDITFVYRPLMIIRCAILWIISKIAFGIL